MGVILAALGISAILGGANAEIRRFENAAARDIAGRLEGEHRRVSVKTKPNGLLGHAFFDLASATIKAQDFSTPGLPLFTDPEFSRRGRIGELRIELDNFEPAGLKIESLRSVIPNCRFDAGLAMRERQIRLSKSGVGQGEVKVRQEALEPFILKTVREIKQVKVKLEKGKAWIEGYGEFLVAKTEFLVVADLEIKNKTEIHLANAKVIFGWRKADEASKGVLLSLLNPVVDLRKDLGLLDAIDLESVSIANGLLTARGSTRIPVRPKS